MRKKDFKITIVTPFYNEEEGGMIDMYFSKTITELDKITQNWEIVAIDDGSIDNTYNILESHHKKNKKIKILKLSRNFGKEAALTAGLDFSSSDITIPMDADLQDAPELIKKMLVLWKEGYDIVIPKRVKREDSFFKRYTASLFYILIKKISKNNTMISHTGDFRLIDKKALEHIKSLKEYHRFMKGILSWPGFKTITIDYERKKRQLGNTKYNYYKLFSHAIDGIFSFSIAPIRLITTFGLLLSLTSFLYGFFLIYKKLSTSDFIIKGYTSVMVTNLFLGGTIILSLGIIGEYVGRIYDEVKNRPIYIIDRKLL